MELYEIQFTRQDRQKVTRTRRVAANQYNGKATTGLKERQKSDIPALEGMSSHSRSAMRTLREKMDLGDDRSPPKSGRPIITRDGRQQKHKELQDQPLRLDFCNAVTSPDVLDVVLPGGILHSHPYPMTAQQNAMNSQFDNNDVVYGTLEGNTTPTSGFFRSREIRQAFGETSGDYDLESVEPEQAPGAIAVNHGRERIRHKAHLTSVYDGTDFEVCEHSSEIQIVADVEPIAEDKNISDELCLPSPKRTILSIGRKWILIGLGLLLAIVLVVGVTVPLTPKTDGAISESNPMLATGPPLPTVPPTDFMALWLNASKALDNQAANADPATPQYKALRWLSSTDAKRFELFSSETTSSILIDRFIIVLLYFATNGPNWIRQHNFLKNSSVCEWNDFDSSGNESLGVMCDGDGSVIMINLSTLIKPAMLYDLISLAPVFNLYSSPFYSDSNNLDGTLPSELGRLSNLISLDLGMCHSCNSGSTQSPSNSCIIFAGNGVGRVSLMSSSIPSEIGLLTNLTSLRLCKCCHIFLVFDIRT